MSVIKVLLVDDHTLFREGLTKIIGSQVDFKVVGQASDGIEALVMAQALKPDLVLMDINMPGCDGIEATRQIKESLPDTTVVMLTVRDEDELLFEAIRCGAQGYIIKSISSQEMLKMLRGAMQGEAALTPNMSGRMLLQLRKSGSGRDDNGSQPLGVLTCREREILCLAAQGLTNREIGLKLCLSVHTVKSHMRKVLSKMGVGSRHDAAAVAQANGIIAPPVGSRTSI